MAKIEAVNTPEHISALKAEIQHLQQNVVNTRYDTGYVKETIRLLQHRVRELEAGKELWGPKWIKG